MTYVTKKGVWAIVLGALAAAMLIFFAWATAGFKNWDAATWFDYWGKGKPAKVVKVAEPPAQQNVMALTSSDEEVTTLSTDNNPEYILDSADGVTTIATEQLATPVLTLSIDEKVLTVVVPGDVLGSVPLSITNFNGKTINVMTLAASRFTSTGSSYVCEVPYSAILPSAVKAYNDTHFIFPEFNYPVLNFVAFHKKSGYITSDESDLLTVLYFPNIESELSNMEYKVGCLEKLYTIRQNSTVYPYSLEFGYNTDDGFQLVSDLVLRTPMPYSDGKISLGMVRLCDFYPTSIQGSRVYSLIFNYKPFPYTFSFPNSSPSTYSCTVYPLYAEQSVTSFTITRLTAPTNFTFNEGMLTWDPVEGATQYGVFWTEGDEDKQAFVDTPSYTFNVEALGEGEHTVRVRALGNMAQTAVDNGQAASITAYNAGNVITQVVSLTYNVDGDTVTKFVPVGSKLSEYTYEVKVPNKEFGGWFYDAGFSRAVDNADTVNKDITIYARLSDKKVVERKATWWDEYQWYIWGGLIALAALGIVAGVVAGIRKRRVA